MVLIITFAHNNPAKNYNPFFDAIKSNSAQWWHFMESTWIVSTAHSADQFAHLLFPHMETTDYLLVARLHPEHQGWLPKEAWDWLNNKSYD
jgi:hypothetical protein